MLSDQRSLLLGASSADGCQIDQFDDLVSGLTSGQPFALSKGNSIPLEVG